MPLRKLAIDFDSFFASVEQQDRPELRGKPVGVVSVLAETTGLIAVSGEAKKLGVKRGARVAEARQRCPGLVIVESRPEVYIDYHRRLKAIIESCVPVKKVQSIDELECELTADFSAAPERARQRQCRTVSTNRPHYDLKAATSEHFFQACGRPEIQRQPALT